MSKSIEDVKRAAEIGFDAAIDVLTMKKSLPDAMKDVKKSLSDYENEKKEK